MKEPAKIVAYGLHGMPSHSVVFTLEGGKKISVRLGREDLNPDGSSNFDRVPELVKRAAEQEGYRELIGTWD